jgi:two-component system phosphate regulon sensor histidine kinase PhoR
VANISHDLRTPLTSLRLLTDSLRDRRRSDPAQETVLDQMAGQIDVLQRITDGLIELDRMESGRSVFRLRPERLAGLMGEAVESLRPQIAERALEVHVDVDADVSVLADRAQIVRALLNIIDNAQRYAPVASRIDIVGRRSEDLIEVSIADRGPGILAADLERVFERFYRGDRARSGGGSGLGLAIARHIVEGHGGTIRAVSPRGGGTRIHLTLLAA